MRQERLFTPNQVDERYLGLVQQLRVSRDGLRIIDNSHVHMGSLVGQCDPTSEISEIFRKWFGPCRITHHHVAGTWRKAKAFESTRELVPKNVERFAFDRA